MTLPADYITAVMADSPWGFWGMQETSGTTMADSSGNSHGGLYDVAVVSQAGPVSGATSANFTTSAAFIAGVRAQASSMAFEFWSYATPPVGTASIALDYVNSGSTQGFELGAMNIAGSGPNPAFSLLSPSTAWAISSHPMWTAGLWQHNVLQFDTDGHVRSYGRPAGSSAHFVDDFGSYTMNLPSTPNLYIGRRANGSLVVPGNMCAVAFYDHPLTVTRMDEHYNRMYSPAPLPSPCVPRIKSGMPAVQFLNDFAVQSAVTLINLPWAGSLLATLIGTSVQVDILCSELPQTLVAPDPSWLINPVNIPFDYFRAIMWPYWCECTPATPGPAVPPYPTWTQPTNWPSPQVYVVNPTNPCLDLTEVRRKLDELLRQVSLDLAIDTNVGRRLVPGATARGVTHSGLSSSGSITISAAIGVQVVITERPPDGRVMEGAPEYVWDLGWLSIMDGNGFIEERRLTREVEVWMPRLMSEAITFGYFFKVGVTANVTILYPLP